MLIFLFVLDLFFVAGHFFLPHPLFSITREWNVPTFYEGLKLLLAGGVTLTVLREPPVRLLGLLLTYASLDEIFQLHEKAALALGPLLPLPEWFEARFSWIIIFLPAFALMIYLILRLSRTATDSKVRTYLRTALWLYGFSVLMEGFESVFHKIESVVETGVIFEETAELLAASLLLAAMLRLARPGEPSDPRHAPAASTASRTDRLS